EGRTRFVFIWRMSAAPCSATSSTAAALRLLARSCAAPGTVATKSCSRGRRSTHSGSSSSILPAVRRSNSLRLCLPTCCWCSTSCGWVPTPARSLSEGDLGCTGAVQYGGRPPVAEKVLSMPTRREFIENGALVTGAACLGLEGSASTQAQATAPTRQRFAIALHGGAGNWAAES